MRTEDHAALEILFAKMSQVHPWSFHHFIYIPERTNADVLAAKLRTEGYDVEVRPGADRINWLLLASHVMIPDEDVLDQLRGHFNALAEAAGGEYDGWEAEAPRTQSAI